MPIKTLEGRVREVLRIRMGIKVPSTKKPGTTFPKAIHTFRLTSPSRTILEEAADLWGGDVTEWRDDALPAPQWQVTTEASVLPCLIPPAVNTFSQWYEMWSGGGCARRCDGERNVITDGPCECPADVDDRNRLAADGKACRPVTRLSIMLPQLHEFGVARLESHGYYAAVELAGAQALYRAATAGGEWMPAELRIEHRTVRRPGEPTKRFIVPALAIRTSLGETLEAIGVLRPDGLPAGPRPAIPGAPGPVAELGPGDEPQADDAEIVEPDLDAADGAEDATARAMVDVVPDERAEWESLAVTRCHEAGLNPEDMLTLIGLITHGRTTKAGQMTDPEWFAYWQIVDRIRLGSLGMILVDAPDSGEARWRFSDTENRPVRVTWDDQGRLSTELLTSNHYASPADWKEMLKGSGVNQAGLIRQARTIAASIGVDPPSSLDDLVDADLCSRLAAWVAQGKARKEPAA